jgi:hypothetical protein
MAIVKEKIMGIGGRIIISKSARKGGYFPDCSAHHPIHLQGNADLRSAAIISSFPPRM